MGSINIHVAHNEYCYLCTVNLEPGTRAPSLTHGWSLVANCLNDDDDDDFTRASGADPNELSLP